MTETRLSKKRTRLCSVGASRFLASWRRMQIIIRREIKGPERTGRSWNLEKRVNNRKCNRDEPLSKKARAPSFLSFLLCLAVSSCTLLPVPRLVSTFVPVHTRTTLPVCVPRISFLPNSVAAETKREADFSDRLSNTFCEFIVLSIRYISRFCNVK